MVQDKSNCLNRYVSGFTLSMCNRDEKVMRMCDCDKKRCAFFRPKEVYKWKQ